MDFSEQNQLFSYQSQPSSPIKSNILSKSPSSILDINSIVYPDINANDNGHTENNIKITMKSETKAEKSLIAKSESETNAWSRNEIFKFFVLYKKYYKDFQAISTNLNTRTKDQVRQFYYRLVTKITTMLLKYGYISEELKIKEKNYIHRAILSYYNVLKSVKPNNKRYMNPKYFSKALIKKMKYCKASLQSSPTSLPSTTITTTLLKQQKNTTRNKKNYKHNNISNSLIQNDIISLIIPPPTINENNIKNNNQQQQNQQQQQPNLQQPQQQQIQQYLQPNIDSVIPPSFKAIIQLIPFDNQTSSYMEQCLYNPLLEITCTNTKPISVVTNHLYKKWNRLYGYTITLMNENAKEITNFNCLLNTLPYHNNVIRLYYKWIAPVTYNSNNNNKCINKYCTIQNKTIKRIKPTLITKYLTSENQRNVIGFIQATSVFTLPFNNIDVNPPLNIVNKNDSLMQSSLNPFVEDDLLTIPEITRFPIIHPETQSFCF